MDSYAGLTHDDLDTDDAIAEARAEAEHLTDLERGVFRTKDDVIDEVMRDSTIPHSEKPAEIARRWSGGQREK